MAQTLCPTTTRIKYAPSCAWRRGVPGEKKPSRSGIWNTRDWIIACGGHGKVSGVEAVVGNFRTEEFVNSTEDIAEERHLHPIDQLRAASGRGAGGTLAFSYKANGNRSAMTNLVQRSIEALPWSKHSLY
jgi:hypothetical protein